MQPDELAEEFKLLASQVLPADSRLFDLRLSGRRGNYRLQITIDKSSGTQSHTSEEVALFAREFTRRLDEEKPELAETVSLEVSTPGVERPLRVAEDYQRFIGFAARITWQPAGERGETAVPVLTERYRLLGLDTQEGKVIVRPLHAEKGRRKGKGKKNRDKSESKKPILSQPEPGSPGDGEEAAAQIPADAIFIALDQIKKAKLILE